MRFAAGVGEVAALPQPLLLEVGPGRTLRTLARGLLGTGGLAVGSLRHPGESVPDLALLLRTAGTLWLAGVPVEWKALYGAERRRRLPLPTYPFQRRRYWIDRGRPLPVAEGEEPQEEEAIGSELHGRPQLVTAYVPPRDELEQQLASIWQQLLGIERVGVHDDFFDLGGHSLLAVSVMAEIRGRLGTELPIETLVGEGTVAALARRVRSSAEGVRSPLLVELQAGGEGAVPLFCIHPMGGGTMGYRDLAQALGPEQPVWGLRARGLMAGEEPLRRIEEMAELYLEAVRRQRPRGPYGLLGWSFGGMVAWEMARRLRDAGEEVPVLALVDLAARITSEMLSADELDLLVEGLRGMIPLTRDELAELAEEKRLRLVVGKLRAAGAVGEDFEAADVRPHLEARLLGE